MHRAGADENKTARRIDAATAQRLVAQAVYGATRDLEYFNFDSSISRRFSPPFLAFQRLTAPPAEGIFGVFAGNSWTGDVWALWGCHRLSTSAPRKSQAAIRRRFGRDELKQHAKLRRLEPECIVED